jgi:hypothetical protein
MSYQYPVLYAVPYPTDLISYGNVIFSFTVMGPLVHLFYKEANLMHQTRLQFDVVSNTLPWLLLFGVPYLYTLYTLWVLYLYALRCL